MKQFFITIQKSSNLPLAAALLTGLLLTRLHSYLLFHSLAELFSIVIACLIFVLAWNTRRFLDHGYLLFMGIAFLFVAILDLLHVLAYRGMGVFAVGDDPNLATQLWIAARYLQSLSLLIAPLFLRRKVNTTLALAGFSAGTALLLLSIFTWQIFPDSYLLDSGLTLFKRISEFVIILLLGGSLALLYRFREEFDGRVLQLLTLAIFASIFAELAFTAYFDVYGWANLAGHVLKIIAFYWIYKAIVETGLIQPYNLLFRNLNAYAGQLQESNRELQDFASIASHDLQEPLRKVQAFGERLKEHYGPALDEEGRDYLERMQSAVTRMQQMIEGLLAYSRVTTLARPETLVNLSQVLGEALSDLEYRLEQTRGKVEAAPLPVIKADPLQMRQLLQNLVSNALKFHRPGISPVVRIYTLDHQGAAQEGKEGKAIKPALANSTLQLVVEDNGIGFDEAHLGELFKPFHRLHGRSEYEGSGMGLAICRKIAERHGGSITAQSTPGQGAKFIVTLKGKSIRSDTSPHPPTSFPSPGVELHSRRGEGGQGG